MGSMAGVIVIITIVFGSVTIITLGSIWLGTSYSAKKRGFVQGATQREVEQIRQNIALIQKDIADLKEQMTELIIVTKESGL